MGTNDDSKGDEKPLHHILPRSHNNSCLLKRNQRKVIISFALVGIVFKTSIIIGNSFNFIKKILFTDVAVIKNNRN